MDPIETFTRAVDQTGRIVAAVTPDQLGKPTPCADWDVRALLNHTISGVYMFDDAAQEKDFDTSRFTKDLVGTDPADSYEQARSALEKTVRQPGVFGPEQECDAGASMEDRLAAFLGRKV